jgi:hypothetical protein
MGPRIKAFLKSKKDSQPGDRFIKCQVGFSWGRNINVRDEDYGEGSSILRQGLSLASPDAESEAVIVIAPSVNGVRWNTDRRT